MTTGRIDPQQVRQRFERLSAILGDIVTQADAQAAQRCPYRDRHDLCTALFRCRHQARLDRHQARLDRNQVQPDRSQASSGPPPAATDGEQTAGAGPAPDESPLRCTHDGAFEYRSAWESNPRARAQARRSLLRQGRPGTSGDRPPRPHHQEAEEDDG